MANIFVRDSASLEKDGAAHQEHISMAKEQHGELTPEELLIEKKLRRKIDLRILPLIILVYVMNYIDRNNYSAAKLQGLQKDLHLVGNEYQIALSVFFVAYVLMQVPSNLLLNYSGRPSLYLGFFIVAWGLVSALTSQVKGYGDIVACRFVLGIVEAPFFAGVLFYLSKWYTKSELSFRMAIFYSGSLVSGAFGSLIAAGILKGLNGARGLSAWQWLYIIEGSITILIGLLVLVVLPDFPDTWRALDPEMRRVANRRLAIDAAEADVDVSGAGSQIRGMILAFKDPKMYILAVMYHCITGASGFQYFFPQLTSTLGFNHIIALLLVAPPYIFMVFYSLMHSLTSDKLKNRFWFWIYPQPLVMAGFVIFMTTSSFGPRYFSFFLMVGVFALNGTIYAWISNAIPRPPAKRAAAFAFINSFGNAASIWTPFTYYDTEAPHYRTALGINIGLLGLSMVCAVILRWYTVRQNRALERLEAADTELDEREIARLQKTAEFEGVDLVAARRMKKSYRYML